MSGWEELGVGMLTVGISGLRRLMGEHGFIGFVVDQTEKIELPDNAAFLAAADGSD